MVYCSAGFNKFIVTLDKKVHRCWALANVPNQFISMIDDFDIKKHIIIRDCKYESLCKHCDQINNVRSLANPSRIKPVKNPIFQIFVTRACYNFCPYCSQSDLTKKNKFQIYEFPMQDIISFLNKIGPIDPFVEIIGGEPFLRKDLYQIFETEPKYFMAFSSLMYQEQLEKVLKSVQKNKKILQMLSTIHLHSEGFNWDVFWESVEMISKFRCCPRHVLTILDYNINQEIYEKIRRKSSAYKNVHLKLDAVALSMVGKQINKKLVNQFTNKNFKEKYFQERKTFKEITIKNKKFTKI